MKRYQVYLNPHSISILDEMEKHTNISRSKIIRETVDSLAFNLSRILAAKNVEPAQKLTLDSLVGAVVIRGKKQTNFATRSDRYYLAD